jgi:hypothetical protein
MDARRLTQDELYACAAADFGPALGRLARAYERDADRQRDLLQDIPTIPPQAMSSRTAALAPPAGSTSITSPMRPIPARTQRPSTTLTSSPA